jgi:hypothetical protein
MPQRMSLAQTATILATLDPAQGFPANSNAENTNIKIQCHYSQAFISVLP